MDHQSSDERPDERDDGLQWPPEAEPGPDPDPEFYQRALRRIPRWIALVAGCALPFVWWRGGTLWAASFLAGAIGGYWNFVGICRIADRLSPGVTGAPAGAGRASRFTLRSLLRLLFIAAAVFVIIRFTRINLIAAFMGLFTPVGAVVLEIIYELTLRHE